MLLAGPICINLNSNSHLVTFHHLPLSHSYQSAGADHCLTIYFVPVSYLKKLSLKNLSFSLDFCNQLEREQALSYRGEVKLLAALLPFSSPHKEIIPVSYISVLRKSP